MVKQDCRRGVLITETGTPHDLRCAGSVLSRPGGGGDRSCREEEKLLPARIDRDYLLPNRQILPPAGDPLLHLRYVLLLRARFYIGFADSVGRY